MVILVTGGCGYIGSQLIRDLATDKRFEGSTVRVLDNMVRERYVSLMDMPAQGDFEFIEGDIRKDEDLRLAFRDVEEVVDLAGITNAPVSFERKELTFDVNVNGGRRVVEHALKSEVDRFIYSSTASVYGPTIGIVDEESPCKPISPYGESKLQAERAVIDAARKSGLNATVLRLGTVFGYSVGMRFDTVVDRFTYLACIGMALTVWESAQREKRPYLHLRDATDALVFAMRRDDMKGAIYNVVGENASIGRITSVIQQFVPDVRVIVTPTPSLNQVSYELDASRIGRLGFRTGRSLEEGVREIADRFRHLLKRRHRLHPSEVGSELAQELSES